VRYRAHAAGAGWPGDSARKKIQRLCVKRACGCPEAQPAARPRLPTGSGPSQTMSWRSTISSTSPPPEADQVPQFDFR
jgi:hypothetical protein